MQIKAYKFQLILLMLIIVFLLFYISRIKRDYIESGGDNYSYQLFSETVFTSRPFKINFKIDYYDDLPVFHQQRVSPPLYPIVLAVIHLIFGSGMRINFYANSLIGVMCALPIFFIGERIGNKWVGILAAFVSLLSPTLRETSITGLSEPLFAFMSLWAVYFLFCFSENDSKLALVWAGLFSGLAYLTRANGIALVVSGALFLFWGSGLRLNKSVWINEPDNHLKGTSKHVRG